MPARNLPNDIDVFDIPGFDDEPETDFLDEADDCYENSLDDEF
jgi:hypothetical protein